MKPSTELLIADAKQSAGTPQKQFTRDELEKHDREDVCWIVVDGKVCGFESSLRVDGIIPADRLKCTMQRVYWNGILAAKLLYLATGTRSIKIRATSLLVFMMVMLTRNLEARSYAI